MTNVDLQVGRMAAFARRDLTIERSYRLPLGMDMIQMAATILITFHVSKLVVDAPELERYGGSYFDFAIVGLGLMAVANLGVSAFNSSIMAEQSRGTVEILLATPTKVSTWLAGSFIFPLVLTVIELAMYFGFGIGVFGAGLDAVGLLLALPVLALTLLSFCAFGVASAAFVVLVKRGDPISGPLITITSILSGALFPVSTFPPLIEALARCFPAFYGIEGVREALLGEQSVRVIAGNVAVLACFDLVLLPTSLLLFKRSLRAARRQGTLASY